MAYNSAIPAATDRISDSQADILANFASLQTVIDINHVTFDDPSGDQGKHKFVSFPEQAVAPVTPANEVALFSQQSTLSGIAELVFAREGAGATIEFTSSTAAAVGWTRLPSGILLKWANGLTTAAGATVYTWPTAATDEAFTAVYGCYITPVVAAGGEDRTVSLVVFDTTTVSTFGSNRSNNTAQAVGYNIFAIGI